MSEQVKKAPDTYEKYQARLNEIRQMLDSGQIKLAATLARVLAADLTKEAQA